MLALLVAASPLECKSSQSGEAARAERASPCGSDYFATRLLRGDFRLFDYL